MSLFTTVKYLFFPARCSYCGNGVKKEELPLCAGCRAEYERLKKRTCRHCGKRYSLCHCPPEIVSPTVSRYLSVFRYDKHTPGGRMLLEVKTRKNEAILSFFGKELYEALSEGAVVRENAVITYVPRNPKKVLKTGMDQAKELAKALSKNAGFPFVKTLKHSGKSRAQKLQNAVGRRENVKDAFSLAPSCPVLFKKQVILVDDIRTSGATLDACAKLLKRQGAEEIICLTVGRSKG